MNISNLGRLIGAGLLAAAFTAFAPSASAQTFAGGLPADWQCAGHCGTTSADGVVGLAPGGGSQLGYVTTDGGVAGTSFFALGGESTGSRLRSSVFSAAAGDRLAYQFNYVSSDGDQFADYAWARLVDAASGGTAAMLFSATTQPAGLLVPSGNLPAIDATLTPPTASIVDSSTVWSPLGDDAGACWGQGCGSSGWVQSGFTFTAGGNYRLEFGVVNWGDSAFDSGLAFDGRFIGANANNIAAPVPEPQTWALMIAGLVALHLVRRRRRL
jgi:hypothetical protein